MYCFDVFYPVGTPLYCDRSEYSAEKFGYVVEEVLLPLALDYQVRSRTNEVDAVASAEVTNLNGDTSVFNAAVKVWRVWWNRWHEKQQNYFTVSPELKIIPFGKLRKNVAFLIYLHFISVTLCLAFLSFFTRFIFSFSISCVQKGDLLKLNFSARFFQTYVKITVLVTIIAIRDHH